MARATRTDAIMPTTPPRRPARSKDALNVCLACRRSCETGIWGLLGTTGMGNSGASSRPLASWLLSLSLLCGTAVILSTPLRVGRRCVRRPHLSSSPEFGHDGDPAVLWHGLLSVLLLSTEGLPQPVGLSGSAETFGRLPWDGHEAMPS